MLRIKSKDSDRRFNQSTNPHKTIIYFKKDCELSSKLLQYFSITLITACSIWSLILVQPTWAEETNLRTLTVTGQGMEMIPTTQTQVNLGVEMQGKNANELQQQVARKTSAVIDLLRSRQVEKLKTTGISLQPNYDYSNNNRKLLGYVATNIVSFRIPTDKIGNLLDEAVKAGATRIDNLNFTADDAAIAKAQKEALRKATVDAQEQAEAVLTTLHLNSKEVVSIKINDTNAPRPQPVLHEAVMKVADRTPVIGGEQTVEAAVTLEISY
jgi:uncharacterized protein YggE